jgi:hypothetical protein
MSHRRLFDVQVLHDFFPAGAACPDLRIEPRGWARSGVRALARHRLLARLCPGGVEVVGPVDGDGRPVVDLEGLALSFDVKVTGADFTRYTDLTDWDGRDLPTYRGSDAAGGPLARVTEPGARPPDVAAGLEISGVSAAWLAAPPRFTLALQSRRAWWVYYLLTARQSGPDPEIRDGDPERALAFDRVLLGPGLSASDDRVGHGLLARHPDRRCFRFLSARPIAARRTPARGLSLYLGPEQLVRELPNPDIHSQTTLAVAPEGAARGALSCVLEV